MKIAGPTFSRTLVWGIAKDDLTASEWGRLRATTRRLRHAPFNPGGRPPPTAGVDCLLVDIGVPVGASVARVGGPLRYIGVFGTGYAPVDVEAASRAGATVTNVPGYATTAVAEFTMAALLAELRGLPERGRSAPAPPRNHHELRGRTVGIVGLGKIGAEVARIARKGFGAEVLYWSRSRRPAAERDGLRYRPLDRLLRQCDVISIHAALTPASRGLLSARRLRLIPPDAIVVNFASAGLVDMGALLPLLPARRLRYIIDHADEVQAAHLRRLRRLRGVRIYPPIGYETVEARGARAETFVSNVEFFLRGDPRYVVSGRPP